MGRATNCRSAEGSNCHDFNPRPPWGGRRARARLDRQSEQNFNPRPPWGGRQVPLTEVFIKSLFQSTPSVGRATAIERKPIFLTLYFNPRPPWGGRRCRHEHGFVKLYNISIHALRGEGDGSYTKIFCVSGQISIHALRGEGDNTDFGICRLNLSFQSTPSVGRATWRQPRYSVLSTISIHALRGEGDQGLPTTGSSADISIHALRGEGDYLRRRLRRLPLEISIHALRGEGDSGSGKDIP